MSIKNILNANLRYESGRETDRERDFGLRIIFITNLCKVRTTCELNSAMANIGILRYEQIHTNH